MHYYVDTKFIITLFPWTTPPPMILGPGGGGGGSLPLEAVPDARDWSPSEKHEDFMVEQKTSLIGHTGQLSHILKQDDCHVYMISTGVRAMGLGGCSPP